jgi:hypothetical protein
VQSTGAADKDAFLAEPMTLNGQSVDEYVKARGRQDR